MRHRDTQVHDRIVHSKTNVNMTSQVRKVYRGVVADRSRCEDPFLPSEHSSSLHQTTGAWGGTSTLVLSLQPHVLDRTLVVQITRSQSETLEQSCPLLQSHLDVGTSPSTNLALPPKMSASDLGLYENTNSSTSTLRPRNARLISYLEDQSEPAVAATTTSAASSKASSLFASHSDSPSQGLGRVRSLNKSQNTNEITSHHRSTSLSEPSGDIWSSWSSIASSFLGSDTHSTHKGKNKPPSRPPKWMKQDRAYHSHPLSPHWGPKTGPPTMVSSPDDRQALVQAKKREAMLSSSTGVKPDATGHHKRRDSDAHLVYNESEEEVLVYKHQVKNDETLPGVILRYGCQQDVFRKANGLWYNNSFQMRKHVLCASRSMFC